MKPDNIILEGICGSKAYGLDTPESDEDVKGIFVAPTSKVVGLKKFAPRETYDHVDPDWCYHEVGKFIDLAVRANPTIIELLWLDGYRVLSKQGHMLVDNRQLFLSNRIRKSYSGYALSQARKLNARGSFGNGRSNRYEKHARHCFRLLLQGRQLLETGAFEIRVSAKMRDELFAIGKLEPQQLVDRFTQEFIEFDKIKSVLPDEPNRLEINKLLLKIRKGNW